MRNTINAKTPIVVTCFGGNSIRVWTEHVRAIVVNRQIVGDDHRNSLAAERHGSPSRRSDLAIVKTHCSATLVHPIVRPAFCVDARRARRNSVQARV